MKNPKSIRLEISFDGAEEGVLFHSRTQQISIPGVLYPSQLALIAKVIQVIREHDEGTYSRKPKIGSLIGDLSPEDS